MADLIYAVSSFERKRGDFPPLPVINMLAEEVQTEPGTTLQSRPGLMYEGKDYGEGPVRGIFQVDGIFNKDLFVVSGNKLYRNDSFLGEIDGTERVSFAGYENKVFVNAGAGIWMFDGTTLTRVNFPDNANVSKIVVGMSRLVAIRKGTGTFYWSQPLEGTIDALAFATAENSPDALLDMLYVGDKLILFGSETIEFWPVTLSDPDLPFMPLIGAVQPIGCRNNGAAAEFARTYAWVTNYNEICVGDPTNIISEPELQIRIQNSKHVNLWTFFVDDAEYLAIRIDNETWVWGARTTMWSQLRSHGKSNWLPQCFDNGYFGTTENGKLVKWSPDYTDFGGVLERSFRAWAPLTTDVMVLGNIALRTNPGTTPYIVGLYTDPLVEMRTSRDGGKQWQPWLQRTLGTQGAYRRKVFWRSLGQFSFPGALIDFRCVDPVPFRVSGLSVNEPYGGR